MFNFKYCLNGGDIKALIQQDIAKSDLMNLLLNVMIDDPDPELGTAIQLTNIIRILLDPENMLRSSTEKGSISSKYSGQRK